MSNPDTEPKRSGSTPISRALHRISGRWGTRIGLVWMGIVAIGAVFGPVIANSYPYVGKLADGTLIWPLFFHLSRVDTVLLLLPFLTVVLWFLPVIPRRWKMVSWLVMVAVLVGGVWLTKPLPPPDVFKKYRDMQASGEMVWAVYAPVKMSSADRLGDVRGVRHPVPPTWALGNDANENQITGQTHWLGTEATGSDVLSQMIHACRIALAIGFISTGIAVFIGIVIGGLMGYFSRLVDLLGMRLVEVFEAIPVLFLLLAFIAFFGRDDRMFYIMMVIIGFTSWTGYARFTRAEFLRLRQQDYVTAARAMGLPLRSILFRHMLPNGVSPVLVTASFGVASAILYESTLSFLGLGLVNEPSWGRLLNQATTASGGFHWWIATFPGLAIFLTVFAYNLIGEAMRDVIDPKTE